MFHKLIIVGCLLLISCGSGTTKQKLGKDDIILAFGDSLTFGTGVSKEQSYPEVLQELIGYTVVRSGVPGEVTQQGLRRLPGILDKYQPKLLLLCHGGNDFLRKKSKQHTTQNLEKMVELAQERGIEVMLIGVPKPGLMLSTSDIYEEVATKYNLLLEDSILSEILSDQSLKSDPIHPNQEGYEKMAQAIADVLFDYGVVE